jgi:hypothetical protein
MRQWFLNFFGSLLEKILIKMILLASMKTLTNTEACTESRHRILPRLTITICVIGWFPPRDHLIGQGKSRPNYTCAIYGTICRIAFDSFTVTGGFLNTATSFL